MTRRSFAKIAHEVLETLGAVNGTGYNKAKILEKSTTKT